MPKSRNPEAEKAEALYRQGKKLIDIANELNLPAGTIRRWKSSYKWDSERSDKKANVRKEKKETKPDTKIPKVDNALTEPLNENQRLFCEYYVNNRNATQAYIKAYGVNWESANTAGARLLADVRVRAYVEELLRLKRESIFLEGDDLIERQMRIAFADMTDFVDFGVQMQPIIVGGKTLYSKEIDPETGFPVPVMQQTNAIRFKSSDEVDGGLICEISTSKQGAKIKLEDRQKALDWLSSFFMINPNDKHKQEFDAKRLAIEERAVKLKEDKEHGLTKDIEAIREGLKDIFSSINSPVPNRVIDDE